MLRPSLESERLLLRPFAADDLAPLLAIHSHPEVARYLYWEPRDEARVREALAQRLAMRFESDGDGLGFAVVLKSSSELVGDFSIMLASAEHRTAELGFLFHPDHHGRGYATEAGELLLELAFDELGLHRVIGRLEARNAASAHVLERLGMRREAHFVENEFVKDEWQSEFDYAILEREWRARRAGA